MLNSPHPAQLTVTWRTVRNHFQSDGSCQQTCLSSYAFAILQGSSCWCSDYIPADTTFTSSCDEHCPGFPSDTCGSTSSGLFGYIALNKSPSGTAGASSAAATTSNSQPTQAVSDPLILGPWPTTLITLSSPSPSSPDSFSLHPGSTTTLLSSIKILTNHPPQSTTKSPSVQTEVQTVTPSVSVQISTVIPVC